MIILGRTVKEFERLEYTVTSDAQPDMPVRGDLAAGTFISIDMQALGLTPPFSVTLATDCLGAVATGVTSSDVSVCLTVYPQVDKPAISEVDVRTPVDPVS